MIRIQFLVNGRRSASKFRGSPVALGLTRGFAPGDSQDEGGALTGFAFCFYLAAVGLGDLAGYAQAQPRAAPGAGRIRPIEAFEHERELIGGYSDARVRDLESYPTVLFSHAHRNGPSLGRVLYRVVQKDDRYPIYLSLVEGGLNRTSRGCVLDRNLAARCGPSLLHRLGGNSRQILGCQFKGRASVVAAGQGEEALHELPHTRRLLQNPRHALLGGPRVFKAPVF